VECIYIYVHFLYLRMENCYNRLEDSSEKQCSFPFNLVSEELLIRIFCFVHWRNLSCSIILVCHRWFELVREKNLIALLRLHEKVCLKNAYISVSVLHQFFRLKKFNESEAEELSLEYWKLRSGIYNRFPGKEQEILRDQTEMRKAFWCGKDLQQRPSMIIRPQYHFSSEKNPVLLFALIFFEQACEILWKTNSEGISIIIDFDRFTSRNFDFFVAKTLIVWSRKYFKNLLGCLLLHSCTILCFMVLEFDSNFYSCRNIEEDFNFTTRGLDDNPEIPVQSFEIANSIWWFSCAAQFL